MHRAVDEVGGAHEVGDEFVLRPLVDVAWRADLLDAALVHHRDLMRQRERLALVMRHIHGGDAELPLQTLQLEAHQLAQLRVEVRQRLIEQQQLGFHHQCPRQREPLLLAARQLGRLAIAQMVELDSGEYLHHLGVDFGAAVLLLADLQRKCGVGENIHVRPDRIRLEYHTEAAPIGRHEDAAPAGIDDRVVDADIARRRVLQSGNRAQRRGLAAAARTEQREEVAFGNLDADVLRGLDRLAQLVGVLGTETVDPKHGRIPVACRCSSISAP